MAPTIRRAAALLIAILLLGALAPSSYAAHAHREKNVRHLGHFWAWFGPQSWDADYGEYGITVLGSQGATLDLGFSNILCAQGNSYAQSVRNYLAQQRQQLAQNGAKITATSRIGHPSGSGQTYREQVVRFTAKNGSVTGVAVYDYDFAETVDGVNYCYQRSIAAYANTGPWRNGLAGVLSDVANSLAYSGPGAADEEPGMPVPGIGPAH